MKTVVAWFMLITTLLLSGCVSESDIRNAVEAEIVDEFTREEGLGAGIRKAVREEVTGGVTVALEPKFKELKDAVSADGTSTRTLIDGSTTAIRQDLTDNQRNLIERLNQQDEALKSLETRGPGSTTSGGRIRVVTKQPGMETHYEGAATLEDQQKLIENEARRLELEESRRLLQELYARTSRGEDKVDALDARVETMHEFFTKESARIDDKLKFLAADAVARDKVLKDEFTKIAQRLDKELVALSLKAMPAGYRYYVSGYPVCIDGQKMYVGILR